MVKKYIKTTISMAHNLRKDFLLVDVGIGRVEACAVVEGRLSKVG